MDASEEDTDVSRYTLEQFINEVEEQRNYQLRNTAYILRKKEHED
jgi:hypothetical protein